MSEAQAAAIISAITNAFKAGRRAGRDEVATAVLGNDKDAAHAIARQFLLTIEREGQKANG